MYKLDPRYGVSRSNTVIAINSENKRTQMRCHSFVNTPKGTIISLDLEIEHRHVPGFIDFLNSDSRS